MIANYPAYNVTMLQPSNPPAGSDALLYTIGATHAKYFVTQNPSLDALAYDPTAWQARLQALGAASPT